MLYRIDLQTNSGETPVCDLIGPVLLRSYREAIKLAKSALVGALDDSATITRIGQSGSLKQIADVYPDGRIVRH